MGLPMEGDRPHGVGRLMGCTMRLPIGLLCTHGKSHGTSYGKSHVVACGINHVKPWEVPRAHGKYDGITMGEHNNSISLHIPWEVSWEVPREVPWASTWELPVEKSIT